MRAAFVDVDGIRTRYLYEGSGPPLLLIHGLGISADTWCRNIDALAERFTVYAPDLPGHGFTGWRDLDGSASYPKVVEHLVKWIDVLGIDKFSIAGSSYGALVSTLIYFTRPEQVEKLIIIGSGSMFRPESKIAEGFGKSYENATSALRNPTWETCRQRMANVCYDPASVTEEVLLIQLTSYAQPIILHAYEQYAAANFDVELTRPHRAFHRLDQIKVPTIVITGREDVRAELEDAIAGEKQIPNSELVIFDKCGHLPQSEHPELFNKTVLEFLAR